MFSFHSCRIRLANSMSARSPVPCCDDVEEADEAAVPARDAFADAACIAPCLGGIDFFFLFSEAESNILPSVRPPSDPMIRRRGGLFGPFVGLFLRFL